MAQWAYEVDGGFFANAANRLAALNLAFGRLADDFAHRARGYPQEMGMFRVIFRRAIQVGTSELKRTCIERTKAIRAGNIFGPDPGEPGPPRLGFGSFSLGESLVLA